MKKKTMSNVSILDNQLRHIQVTDAGVLKVCICGEHTNDSIPISRLTGCGVLLHYVDRNGDVVPWKFDSLKDKIEGMEVDGNTKVDIELYHLGLDRKTLIKAGYNQALEDILKLLEK